MAAYTQYEQYGGNPYSSAEPGSDEIQTSPYEQGESHELRHMSSSAPQGQTTQEGANYIKPRTQREYLDQVEVIRELLKDVEGSLSEVSKLHQRLLDATDPSSAAELGPALQQIESQTQSRNEQIRRLIKNLAQDAANTTDDTKAMKLKQISPLKTDFQSKIRKYQDVERDYRTKRREQIRRQFLIVNPDATDTELASVADTSGDPLSQNVFQMALTNRRGQAQSALGAVKARHEELQRIERTMIDLSNMFNDMDQLVTAQDPFVEQTEQNAQQATEDVEKGNVQVSKAIVHARHRNKLKWWCLFIVFLIMLAIALGVGLGVGLAKAAQNETT